MTGVLVFGLVLLVSAYSGADHAVQRVAETSVRNLRLFQSWEMYAPSPSFTTSWVAVEGVKDSGAFIRPYPDRDQTHLLQFEKLEPHK